MTKVIIRRNPLDPISDEEHIVAEGISVRTFLMDWFGQWPSTAVLYQDEVKTENRIPLKTEADVDALENLQGTIYVVIHPAGFAAIGLALIGATIAIGQSSKKKQSTSNEVSRQQSQEKEAPNNSLSERSNTARVGGRIPDIYGTIRAVPDLIAQPYRYYDDNREVEHSYLCLGRGEYTVWDIRQEETKTKNVTKNVLEIYGPYTSPNRGMPSYSEGVITEPFIETKKIDGFSGQTLIAPNKPEYQSSIKSLQLRITPTGYSLYTSDPAYDLTDHFLGSTITLTAPETVYIHQINSYTSYDGWSWWPVNTSLLATLNLGGTFTIDTITSNTITLDNPGAVNAAWNTLASYIPDYYTGALVMDGPPPYGKIAVRNNILQGGSNIPLIDTRELAESRIIGPIIVDYSEDVLINFSADNGLYLSGNTADPSAPLSIAHLAASVDVRITYQLVDANDVPFGSTHVEDVTITSDGESTNKFGYTHRSSLPFAGKMCIKIERTSDTPINVDDQIEIQDEIAIESLYTTRPITNLDFGDITTIRTISYAGKKASGTRKLNMRVSRKIPRRISGTDFTAPEPTSLASDIIVAIATDPKLGGRSLDELDLDSIYTASTNVISYFGTHKAAAFNYSFDDDNLSLEEMIGIVSEAMFCVPYRQTEKLKLLFEQLQTSSVLLFNHRNKIPGSENRSVSFGILEDKDGVEIEYANEDDNKPERLYLPENQSAIEPENVKLLGVIHKVQAYFHAHRYRNRQLFQNTAVEFDALQEANMLVRMNRIQVADNTRSETWDGQIEDQDGTTLLLSQEFAFVAGKTYTIFIQNTNGTVQAIGISPGSSSYEIELDGPTTQPLSTSDSAYAKATYQIVENGSLRKQTFLIEEKSPKEGLIVGIKAFNYEDGYYTNDKDYINGVVDGNGDLI